MLLLGTFTFWLLLILHLTTKRKGVDRKICDQPHPYLLRSNTNQPRVIRCVLGELGIDTSQIFVFPAAGNCARQRWILRKPRPSARASATSLRRPMMSSRHKGVRTLTWQGLTRPLSQAVRLKWPPRSHLALKVHTSYLILLLINSLISEGCKCGKCLC